MAGYHDNLQNDLCNRQFEDNMNSNINNYYLNYKFVMRDSNNNKCQPLGVTNRCDFYGPLNSKKIKQDSYITGRGHILSDCPDCDVRHLPQSLFQDVQYSNKSTELDPLYTRVPKSCNGLSEITTYAFSQMPGAYEHGYNGYNSVVDTNIQTRMSPYNLKC
jgi:hypothetical protein